jgi:hypothetical protein
MKTFVVPSWIATIKHFKERWTASMSHPDIPPTVLVVRNELIEAMVIAPQVDRDKGFLAAQALYYGFEPDALLLAFEVCRKRMPSADAALEPGQLQRELEAGSSEVQECIMIYEGKTSGEVNVWDLSYQGKGLDFEWLDFNDRSTSVSGLITDNVRAIMTDASGKAKHMRAFSREIAEELKIAADLVLWHQSRGTLLFLETLDYHCFDYRVPPEGAEVLPLKTETTT